MLKKIGNSENKIEIVLSKVNKIDGKLRLMSLTRAGHLLCVELNNLHLK